MKLGFLGVGHLATSLLAGLRRADWPLDEITLAPRGQAQTLAAAQGYQVARDNSDLVATSEVVLLAVRPDDAAPALRGLPWRRDHLILSACAGVTLATLQAAAPKARIIRIMPITAAELGASPTLVFPDEDALHPLLSAFGSVIALRDENEFEVATVAAAIYGWVQVLISTGADWSGDNGLDPVTARQLIAETFVAAGRMIAEQDAPMAELLHTLVTPGGITEAGLETLETADVPKVWRAACDCVLSRLK